MSTSATAMTFTTLQQDVRRYLERGATLASDAVVYEQIPRLINLAERRIALEEAWRAGPHPSQVQRRRDEAWDRRKSLMQVSAENGYRPLAHRVAAMPAVDPAAAIPAIPLDNAEQVHAHLLGQVLANEGIHRHIVSML